MDLTPLFKRLGKVAVKNSPAILTSIGVTGTVAAAYLAAKGAFEAAEIITVAAEDKKSNVGEGFDPEVDGALTMEEKVNLTWKCYIPAATCVVASAAAMICSNRISDRRAAAMASAYSVVRESYSEYRAKTVKRVGPKKEQEIRDEIAQDRRDRYPVESTPMFITGRGPTRCFDDFNKRYFDSSKNLIDAAVNDLNREVNTNGYASLTDFYGFLGVEAVGYSDYLGWSTDQLLEVDVSGTLDDHGEPCLHLVFKTLPHERFDRAF